MPAFECPVCLFDRLADPPEDYAICPCCGTQFGYHDIAETNHQRRARWRVLRNRWVAAGARFHRQRAIPSDWDALRQSLLERLPSPITVIDVDQAFPDVERVPARLGYGGSNDDAPVLAAAV